MRELDALVAEKVMGCKPLEPLWTGHEGCCGCKGEEYRPHDDSDSDGKVPEFIRYSTTWEGMGLVVEAMRTKEFRFYADWNPDYPEFRAQFVKRTGERGECPSGPDEGNGEEIAPPLAVALAALRAVGS